MRSILPELALLLICSVGTSSQAEADLPRDDKSKLQGTWQVVSWLDDGEHEGDEVMKYLRWTFKGDDLFITKALTVTICGKRTVKGQGGTIHCRFTLDATKKPRMWTTTTVQPIPGLVQKAIYKIEGDILTVCMMADSSKGIPSEFAAKKGSAQILIVLKKKTAK